MGETDFHKCNVFVGRWLYPFQEDMSRTLNREPFACGSQAGLRGEKPGACVDEPWLLVTSFQEQESVLYDPLHLAPCVLICDSLSPLTP